jgi:hypothetical protein
MYSNQIAIAMECRHLRVDVLDVSGESIAVNDLLTSSSVVYDTIGTALLSDHLKAAQDKLDVRKIITGKNRILAKHLSDSRVKNTQLGKACRCFYQ